VNSIRISLKLKPFQTPNFVIVEMPPRPRQEGMQEALSFPLSEVDAETLYRMCDDFRREVFRKAGRDLPPTPTVRDEP